MTNFLTTLKAHMEACESAPSSGHEHMAFWLADHAPAIIGCVEAAQALLKTQKAEEHCGDPNCDICIDYRHLVSALAALEEK